MRVRASRWVAVIVVVAAALAACGGGAATPATRGTPAASLAPVVGLSPVGSVERARVVRVVDGDTLIVDRGNGRERLRYIGIDAPESVKPGTPVEFFGKEASAANAALVDGREVWLETDVSDRDRFDRLLRYVWLRDGDAWTLVNLELVRRGFADAASFPPDVRWQDEFRAAARTARASGIGLWGPATPSPR